MDNTGVMAILLKYIPFFIPVLIIQFSLQIYSIVNLIRRNKVRFNNKLIWGIIILALGLIGPVSYLLLRGDEE